MIKFVIMFCALFLFGGSNVETNETLKASEITSSSTEDSLDVESKIDYETETPPSDEMQETDFTEEGEEIEKESSQQPDASLDTEASTTPSSELVETEESQASSELPEQTNTTESSHTTDELETTESTEILEESTSNSVSETSESPETTIPSDSVSSGTSGTEPAISAEQKAESNSRPMIQRSVEDHQSLLEEVSVDLPESYKVNEVIPSDLKGYELPLMQTLGSEVQAAILYEGIKQVGKEQESGYPSEELVRTLYTQLFDIAIDDLPIEAVSEFSVGSVIYRMNLESFEPLGIYLGSQYYLTVDDIETDQQDETTDVQTKRQVVVKIIDFEDQWYESRLPNIGLTEYGEEVLANYPASMDFRENDQAKAFIQTISEDARQLGQKYDVFASVMIAQALLESGSGTSGLSLPPNHNLFGVKGSYRGNSVLMETKEDRGNGELYSIKSSFRKYPSYGDSLGDYVRLLRGGISGNDEFYQNAWRSVAKNYLSATSSLTGKYATDIYYANKLNSIIALYQLTQYDRPKSHEQVGVFIRGLEDIPKIYRDKMSYPEYDGVDYNTSGSYPVGQCTWYAFNRVSQLGYKIGNYMGNGGDWGVSGQELGYQISREPQAGWLVSFEPGAAGADLNYGHVAFVEAVRPEGILISEGNVYGGQVISYRVIESSIAKSDQVTYIKPK